MNVVTGYVLAPTGLERRVYSQRTVLNQLRFVCTYSPRILEATERSTRDPVC